MVQFKSLTTIMITTAVILPSLAVPINRQGSEDILSRDFDDLLERDLIDLEGRGVIGIGKKILGGVLGSIFRRELNEAQRQTADLKARGPINLGGVLGAVLRRELDDADDLLSRDYEYGDLD